MEKQKWKSSGQAHPLTAFDLAPREQNLQQYFMNIHLPSQKPMSGAAHYSRTDV